MFHMAVNQSFVFGKSIRKTFFYSIKHNQVLPYTDISMVVPWRKDEIVQSRSKTFHALVHNRVFGLKKQNLHVKG